MFPIKYIHLFVIRALLSPTAHLGVGDAETIDSDADEDPEALANDEDDVPSPRNQHAACLVKFNKKEISGLGVYWGYLPPLPYGCVFFLYYTF